MYFRNVLQTAVITLILTVIDARWLKKLESTVYAQEVQPSQ